MPVPAFYDEAGLVDYMQDIFGSDQVARLLGWSEIGDYDAAVAETMLALGIEDLAAVTGSGEIRRLRAVARRELWRLAMQRTAHLVDSSAEGGGAEHSQIHEHARVMYEQAAAEAALVIAEVDAGAAAPARPLFFTRATGGRA